MTTEVQFILTVAAIVITFLVGRATAPKQKAFDLAAAEILSSKLGGLNHEYARVARVAALVGGMSFTVHAEARQTADKLNEEARLLEERAAQLRRQAEESETNAASDANRANEVTNLAALFDD